MPQSILIVTNRAPWPLQDGGALAMHQLIMGYKSQGWEVHLLTMNTHRHWVEEADLRAAYASLDSVTVVPFDNRLRPVRLARNLLLSRKPEHAERFYDAGFERILVETVNRVKPSVVQMESIFLTDYLPAIRKAFQAPAVLRMHNIEHQIWRRTAGEATGAKRLYLRSLAGRIKKYEEWAWNQYQLLLPITPDDAQAALDAGCSTPAHLTPFGITMRNTPARTPGDSPASPRKFYHLGAMDWIPNREGVAWFISEAWPLIQKQSSHARFHFGGRLLEAGFASPLPPGVVNHGPVRNAATFVAGMDILVVPIHAGGGIRIKILEAMAARKLVISTGIGIQGIAAEAGTHYLRADTPNEFSDAVRWIETTPGGMRRITTAARRLVEESYDAGKIVEGLSRRLHSLLQEWG